MFSWGSVMGKAIRVQRLALAAALTALTYSSPGAEEIRHHGVLADSEADAIACLSCHDGQIASPIKLSTIRGNFFCNHPVNRDYPPDDKPADYLPLESVAEAGIRLLNGQVSCISCHNLKNPEKYHLAGSLDKSGLCFLCHKI